MAKKKLIPITEEELVILLQQGDREAMGVLYDKYSDALYGVIYKVLRSEASAEDILQEAFVKIWKNISSYDRTKGRLFTWMLNIARNLAIDKIRSKDYRNLQKNQDIENIVGFIEAQENTGLSTEHIGIGELVQTLKPDQKELVDMVYFRGYTQVEVSEELGIPLGTVKTRLRLAINTLRKIF